MLAALPVVVLLGALGFFRRPRPLAALLGLAMAARVAVLAFGMPVPMAGDAAVYGAPTACLPIGWIVLNVIFLYTLAEQNGSASRSLQDEHDRHHRATGGCSCC